MRHFLVSAADCHLNVCRITSILVSRFLLHLQAVSQKEERGGDSVSTKDGQTEDSLKFATVVGSLGAHIGPRDFTEVTEDEEEDREPDVADESIILAEGTHSAFSANGIYEDMFPAT